MQQENTPLSPVSDALQQEHPNEPAKVTPGIETPDESKIQSREQVIASQLMQVLVQQQAIMRKDIRKILEV